MIYPLNMVIFHSFVKLPEGMWGMMFVLGFLRFSKKQLVKSWRVDVLDVD